MVAYAESNNMPILEIFLFICGLASFCAGLFLLARCPDHVVHHTPPLRRRPEPIRSATPR